MRDIKVLSICFLLCILATVLFAQGIDIEIEDDSSAIVEIDDTIDIGPVHIDIDQEEGELVRIGDDLTVAREDTVREDAVAITSDLTVHGVVKGDAVCISGRLIVTGHVVGDAVVVGGNAEIDSTAIIDGDLVCVGGKLSKVSGAQVGGEVVNIPMPFIRPVLHHALKYISPGDHIEVRPPVRGFAKRIAGFVFYLVKIIALVVFIFLILLFFKGGVDRVSDAIANHFWKSALAGFVGVILLLPLTLLLTVLIIGIPLVPLLWIAVVAGMVFGFACITYTIGRIAAEKKGWKDKSPYILALIGLVVVEIIAFLGNLVILPGGPFMVIGGIIKVFGFIISYIAWMVGFGGVILTRFGAMKFGK
jgi:carbonic anhydrase/acetyltransferase-like protein (isoleucine patch superfamily)